MSKIAIEFGINDALRKLGVQEINDGNSTGTTHFGSGEIIESYSPVDGALIGKVRCTSKSNFEKVMNTATNAFKTWREKPAPQRGEIVRQFGEKLRELKEPLGK